MTRFEIFLRFKFEWEMRGGRVVLERFTPELWTQYYSLNFSYWARSDWGVGSLGFKCLSLSLCYRSTWVYPPRNYSITSRQGLMVSWLSRTDTASYQLIFIISWFWQPFLKIVNIWRNIYKYISDESIKSIYVCCHKIKMGLFHVQTFATHAQLKTRDQ